jgi:DnaK suppressor protein
MQISNIKEQLLKRRREILEQREKNIDSWNKLHEPEVELEEQAAKENISRTHEQLERQEKEEIEQIDAALGKLETSGFGICESCGEKISDRRLEALPWTSLCIDCAEEQQSGIVRAIPDFPTAPGSEFDSDVDKNRKKTYGDKDMQDMIADQLIRDSRVETQELKIDVNKGRIHLEGLLPSQAKHEILMSIIQDVLGFKDIVDSIRIDRQLWEQQRYAPGTEKKERTENEKQMESEGGEPDVWVSRQDGTSLDPSDNLDPNN